MKDIQKLEGEILYTSEHDIPYRTTPDIGEIVEKINEIIDYINSKKDQLL